MPKRLKLTLMHWISTAAFGQSQMLNHGTSSKIIEGVPVYWYWVWHYRHEALMMANLSLVGAGPLPQVFRQPITKSEVILWQCMDEKETYALWGCDCWHIKKMVTCRYFQYRNDAFEKLATILLLNNSLLVCLSMITSSHRWWASYKCPSQSIYHGQYLDVLLPIVWDICYGKSVVEYWFRGNKDVYGNSVEYF